MKKTEINAMALKAQQGDKDALSELMIQMRPIAKMVAVKTIRGGSARYDAEDAEQDGLLATIKAVKAYDPEKGDFVPFFKKQASLAMRMERRKMATAWTDKNNRADNVAQYYAENTMGQTWKRATGDGYLSIEDVASSAVFVGEGTPMDDVIVNELAVEVALSQLTDTQRVIIKLNFGLDGHDRCKVKDIPQATGVPQRTVEREKRTAMRKLKSVMI